MFLASLSWIRIRLGSIVFVSDSTCSADPVLDLFQLRFFVWSCSYATCPCDFLSGILNEHAEDVGLHGQALDIPFTAVGASECNALFRQVLSRNVDVRHLHGTMQEQVEGAPCIYHRKLGGCPLQSCDLAIFGTPCPPFSEMRVNRYKPGMVANHPLAQVTFRDAHNMLVHGGHRCVVMEQVAGFNKPESAGETASPQMRPGLHLIV